MALVLFECFSLVCISEAVDTTDADSNADTDTETQAKACARAQARARAHTKTHNQKKKLVKTQAIDDHDTFLTRTLRIEIMYSLVFPFKLQEKQSQHTRTEFWITIV